MRATLHAWNYTTHLFASCTNGLHTGFYFNHYSEKIQLDIVSDDILWSQISSTDIFWISNYHLVITNTHNQITPQADLRRFLNLFINPILYSVPFSNYLIIHSLGIWSDFWKEWQTLTAYMKQYSCYEYFQFCYRMNMNPFLFMMGMQPNV
jgi:hypothetical protein